MKLTCNKCGTVAFGVTRESARQDVASFNKYYERLSDAKKKLYYGSKGAHISFYERCGCGNPYTNFRPFKEGDCPDGCTLSPIIIVEKPAKPTHTKRKVKRKAGA